MGDLGLIGMNQAWVRENTLHRQAGGEHMAIGIEDIAAPRLFEEDALRVVANDVLVAIMPDDLHDVKPAKASPARMAKTNRRRR